jgi:hypothetical protein
VMRRTPLIATDSYAFTTLAIRLYCGASSQ